MNGFKKIGEKIKHYREEKAISAEVFAKSCEFSVEKLHKIENGEIIYQLSTLFKIASVLKIDLPELLNF